MSLLSNEEIHKIFLDNQDSFNNHWRQDLFINLCPLVISRIKKFKTFSYVQDLEQEFKLALWSAIKSFDHHKHFDFYRWVNWYFANSSRNFQKNYNKINSINLDGNDIKMPDDLLFAEEMLNCQQLSLREKYIIQKIFFEDQSLEVISKELNLSIERVWILKNKAIKKMKNMEYDYNEC